MFLIAKQIIKLRSSNAFLDPGIPIIKTVEITFFPSWHAFVNESTRHHVPGDGGSGHCK
jgi:hypothetical protein